MRKETHKITDYATAAAYMERARNKEAGRPLGATLRLHKYTDSDDYIVKHSNIELCHYHRDGTVTFVMSKSTFQNRRVSLCNVAGRHLPFDFVRANKGVYKVVHDDAMAECRRMLTNDYRFIDWNQYHRVRRGAKNAAPVYYQGIKFKDGTCTNRDDPAKPTPAKDVRRRWVADCAHYRTVLKTMLRVGTLDEIIKLRTSTWVATHPLDVPLLVKCMRRTPEQPEAIFSQDVVDMLMNSLSTYALRNARSEGGDLYKLIDQIFKSHSLALRVAYGVFGDGAEIDAGVRL